MNSKQIYDWFDTEINGIKRKEFFNISEIERFAEMPKKTLRFVLKNQRNINSIDKYCNKIEIFIKNLAISQP